VRRGLEAKLYAGQRGGGKKGRGGREKKGRERGRRRGMGRKKGMTVKTTTA